MPDMNRRGFMGALVAAPVAASAGLKRAIANQNVLGRSLGGDCSADMPGASDTIGPTRWEIFSKFGVPDWKLKLLKDSSKVSPSIEPDIDALRSVSWAAKCNMQSKRNFERRYREMMNEDVIDKARNAWLRKHGLDWA